VVNARMWQPRGKKGTITIKSNTGRKRITILGALNIEDLSIIKTLTEETCNAERIIEFLQKVKEAYPDMKIVILLDNARYNYAKDTRACTEENNILLLFYLLMPQTAILSNDCGNLQRNILSITPIMRIIANFTMQLRVSSTIWTTIIKN